MSPKKTKVLFIEDKENQRQFRIGKLPEWAYNISTTASGSAWIKRVANLKPTVILCDLDLNLPDLSGIQVLNHLKKPKPDVPVIPLTAHGSREFKKYLIIS